MDTEIFDGPIFPVEKTEENCDLIMDVQEFDAHVARIGTVS